MLYSHIIVTRAAPGHHRLIQALSGLASNISWANPLVIRPILTVPVPHDFDDLLMLSPAAVQHAPALWLAAAKRLWVMGAGSASHVPTAWQSKIHMTPNVNNSAQWLEQLQTINWSTRRVLLLKGRYGRDRLPIFFSAHAQHYLEQCVYETHCQRRAHFFNWREVKPGAEVVIQVSSIEGLRGLIHLLGPQGCQWLQSCTLLISGEQQKAMVEKLPFLKRVLVAKSAAVEDIRSALLRGTDFL